MGHCVGRAPCSMLEKTPISSYSRGIEGGRCLVMGRCKAIREKSGLTGPDQRPTKVLKIPRFSLRALLF